MFGVTRTGGQTSLLHTLPGWVGVELKKPFAAKPLGIRFCVVARERGVDGIAPPAH